jgi:thiol-disulfide isomerase/thioredoxin
VNFWATWCDPCRDEFPELVRIANEYKAKLDFVTISMDDAEEINRGVPKFLRLMRATQFANYLLLTEDEDSVIRSISKDWSGGLPFTILYAPEGEAAYTRQGKIRPAVLRAEIEKVLAAKAANPTTP